MTGKSPGVTGIGGGMQTTAGNGGAAGH
jgi:hypothetical protein